MFCFICGNKRVRELTRRFDYSDKIHWCADRRACKAFIDNGYKR
jgi:hypothetical protein